MELIASLLPTGFVVSHVPKCKGHPPHGRRFVPGASLPGTGDRNPPDLHCAQLPARRAHWKVENLMSDSICPSPPLNGLSDGGTLCKYKGVNCLHSWAGYQTVNTASYFCFIFGGFVSISNAKRGPNRAIRGVSLTRGISLQSQCEELSRARLSSSTFTRGSPKTPN